MPPFVPFESASDAEIPARAESIMTAVKRLGANGIRLVMSWEGLEPERGSYDAAYIARYRALLDAADHAGISVLIDFHQDVFQAAFCGDGFPAWALGDIPHGPPHYDCGALLWSRPYFDPNSDVSRAFDRLWNNTDGLQDAFVAMWTKVAREFGKHPAVAAFEVINEPGSGSRGPDVAGATFIPALYDRVASAIEAEIGPVAVLGDDPIVQVNDVPRLTRPEHPRFAYGPHFYDVIATIGAPIDPARISADVAGLLDRGETYGAPVVLGEYGVTNTHPMKPDFIAAVLDTADSRRASAMAWDGSISTMKWNDEDFSVFTSDGAERAWGATLDRPVPRAIDGTILDWQWDVATKKFSLSVEGQEEHVSEIYLPLRHLGASPKITVAGARHRFAFESGIVLVLPERGASWSLTAEPSAAP